MNKGRPKQRKMTERKKINEKKKNQRRRRKLVNQWWWGFGKSLTQTEVEYRLISLIILNKSSLVRLSSFCCLIWSEIIWIDESLTLWHELFFHATDSVQSGCQIGFFTTPGLLSFFTHDRIDLDSISAPPDLLHPHPLSFSITFIHTCVYTHTYTYTLNHAHF